ncbi:MAG: ester cyclase [Solirubrobacteraceae bacterium]
MTIETPTTSASTENRLAARQWVDAFNARDNEGEANARTADYVGYAPDSMHLPALDSDAWVAFLDAFLEGFPDLHLDVQDTVADEQMNAQRILFTGTHTGHFRGLPPTGRKVHFSGLEISRMVNGKAAEHWFQMDTLTMFEQLGLRVVPGPRLLARLMTAPLIRLSKKWRR